MRQSTFQGSRFNTEAMERLGVKLPLEGPLEPGLVCHHPPSSEPLALYGSGSNILAEMGRHLMGLDDDDLAEFLETIGKLAATPRDEAERLIQLTFREWMPNSGLSPATQQAMLSYCNVIWSVPPEDTSVGRFIISHLQTPGAHYHASDAAHPGNQGLVEPYAERFEELGGEIWLGLKPLEILVDDGAVMGVRARTENSFVRGITASTVVFAYVAHQLFDIVDESLFPDDFVRRARATKKYETPLLTQWLGLSDLPRLRRDGAADESSAFHRLMFPGLQYGGGWKIVSNAQAGTAPPGKHLLAVYFGKGVPFAESHAGLTRTRAYVNEYYANLDEIVEWHEYQWIPEAHSMGWAYKVDDRAPQRTPVAGLYLSGYTTDVEGIDYDADACGALRAADAILGTGID
jgi:phytoene dehydrogenase-like protein